MINKFTKLQQNKISSYYSDQKIANRLCHDLEDLYNADLPYHFTLSLEHARIYIYVQKALIPNSQSKQPSHDSTNSYALRLGKSYPVDCVRLHLLKNNCQPRLFDSRDLVEEVLGDIWSYKKSLIQLIQGIQKFEERLENRNEKYLPMQKTGKFQLGDKFNIMELKMFSALQIFRDTKNEEGLILGTTQTHFLTFKGVGQKDKVRMYELVRACDLQCIHEIHQNSNQNEIILTMYKYKSIKSFNEYEKISRKYKLQDSERFIRNILKFINKFQKMSIEFQPSTYWMEEQNFKPISKKIEECAELEVSMENIKEYESKDAMFEKLGKNYQKIIEYFSARASCYYLIFVNKLNNLYSENMNS